LNSSESQAAPRVGLLSPDLLVRSRVQAGLAGHGAQVEMISGDELPGVFGLLLVDLNRDQEQRLAWLRRAIPTQPTAEVICFGPHTEMAQLAGSAKAAGATRCVANSHLAETLQRWLRSGAERRPDRGEQSLDQL